jgi:hypothetical protein
MPYLSKSLSTQIVVFAAVLTCNSHARAAGCENYPLTDGINVEDVQGGTKILSTASATVSFNDVDAIKDARYEALLEAKAHISHFLSEGIKSDQVVSKAVSETKSMQGANKENLRKEMIERVKKLQSSSQALLRGVVPLGDCYTPGTEVRVTVGIKPATIQQAGNLADGIGTSVYTQPTPSALEAPATAPQRSVPPAPGHTPRQPLQGVEGYSNTERLKGF